MHLWSVQGDQVFLRFLSSRICWNLITGVCSRDKSKAFNARDKSCDGILTLHHEVDTATPPPLSPLLRHSRAVHPSH